MSDISFTPVPTTVSLPSVDATVGIPPQSYSIVKPTSDLLSEERPEAQTDTPAVRTHDGTIDDILVDGLLTEARSVLAITDQVDAKLAAVTHKLIDKVEELVRPLLISLTLQPYVYPNIQPRLTSSRKLSNRKASSRHHLSSRNPT